MLARAEFPGQIVVLGDSLSDSGNLPRIDLRISPPVVPSVVELILKQGAPITDGTTWPVFLADQLKASRLIPSSQAGTNFAVAGALTTGTPTLPVPSIATQVTQIPAQLNRNSPVFTWGGGNNLLEIDPLPANAGAAAATDIGNIVQAVHDEGFDIQIVFNLPNLADVPDTFTTSNPNEVIAQGLIFNALLPTTLAQLDFPVLGIDINALLLDIVANPHAYGFTNVTDPAPPIVLAFPTFTPVSAGSPTDGYLFFYDGEHPTEKAHRTIADFVYTTLRAPSFYGALSQKAFSVSREIMVNIRQQTFAVQPCHQCGTLYPFVNGSYAPLLEAPDTPHVHSHDGVGGDVTYGLTYDFNHNWRLGICGSYARHYFENGERLTRSNAHLSTNAASIFGSYQDCHGYINAIFTASWHDFFKIKRFFNTGFASHETRGKTTGIDYHGELSGAWLCFQPAENFYTGPLIDLDYQWVSIKGYHEHGARIGLLQYKKFHNDIFSTGLGWEAQYAFEYCCCGKTAEIVADVYALANRQWLGHTRDIRFRQISFGENFGAWPVVVAQRNNYFSGGLSLSADVCDLALFNFGYNLNIGNHSMSEHVLTFGVTAPLSF